MDKKYSADAKTCTVTITLPAEAAQGAQSVVILGDFNGWNPANGVAMKTKRDGSFEGKVKLETGKSYEFRLLLDGSRWENVLDVDAYVPSPYAGVNNCVIHLPIEETSAPGETPTLTVDVPQLQPQPEEKQKTSPKKTAAKSKKTAAPTTADDLTKIEGIGPKIAQLLNEDGIKSFADLAKAKSAKLKAVLEKAGARYRIHDPSTWAEQAKLALKGEWEKLAALQVELKGGKRK